MRRASTLAAAALLLLAASGCGSGGGSSETLHVSETEFKLDPATLDVDTAGTLTIHAVNDGGVDHALEVEGNGVEEETKTLAPGESADLTVDVTQGTYEIYCPIDGHRSQGMDGELVVAGGGAGGATTDEDEGEPVPGY
jgi:plastocyanin